MDRDRIIRELSKCRLQPDGHTRQYTIAGKLGQGGNGVTFMVRMGRQELVAKVYVPPDSRDLDSAAFKRFTREIELSARTRHPFVVPVVGTGSIAVGAYTFPFYLMPKAKGTLRQLIPPAFTLDDFGKRLRVFTQVLSGVSYLHHIGVFHRDLKPENVLLFRNDIPMVADLGIAHVAPGFVEWSKLTLPKDHLLNWDYYAPEQRGSDATKVDHRADIYALGLILYELISGVSPARPNLPPLAGFHDRLAHVDEMFRKMTAHDPADRYQNLDIIHDELTWTLIAVGIPAGAPTSVETDKKTLLKLLRSTNAEHQARANEIAQRLAEKALPELHEMTGDRRLDVVLAAYRLLGNLAHKDSLPYILAGLYPRRSAQKPRFVTGEAAADALTNYSVDDRLAVLKSVKDLVLAAHVGRVVEGIAAEDSYPVVLKLYQNKLIYEDWSQESGLALLLRLGEDRAWQILQRKLTAQETIYSFTVFRDFFPNVNAERQMILLDYLLKRYDGLSSWEFNKVLAAISTGHFPPDFILSRIGELKKLAELRIRKWDERQAFMGTAKLAEQNVTLHYQKLNKRWAEQQGRGYSPSAARQAKPTP
ncbi:MAG: serine/threonine-protein kinase [Phycisphaerae bacterium]|nr:serine/threonine-protein kinase [Phycisphaerae bacterium]